MKYKTKLGISLPLTLVPVIMYCILGPLEIFFGNRKDLQFAIGDFFGQLLILSALLLITISCLVSLLPNRRYQVATGILLWFGSASYLQCLFMNTELSDLHGGSLDWESLGNYTILNFLVWVLLLAACIILCLRVRSWYSFAKILSICLCLVQTVAIVSVLLSLQNTSLDENDKLYASGAKEFTLSANENIVVFVMDAFGSVHFDDMLAKYPEVRDIMKDFTYYDNADCHYYDTFPSMTHILTGYDFEFGQNAYKWQNDAWHSNRAEQFYQMLHDKNYECDLFMPVTPYVFGDANNLYGKFDNLQPVQIKVNTDLLLNKILKLSIFRCVPYAVKPKFEVLTYEFNDVCAPIDENAPIDMNQDYYQALCSNGLSLREGDKNALIIKYLFGLHEPCITDAQVKTVEDGIHPTETARGLFQIMETYFDYMKRLDVYDSATIIVMADHATWWYDYDTDVQPIFFLKRSGETSDQLKVNSAPISWDDFQSTILTFAGCQNENFGTSIFDWEAGQSRVRTVYRPRPNEEFGRTMFDAFSYNGDRSELQRTASDGPDFYEEYLSFVDPD